MDTPAWLFVSLTLGFIAALAIIRLSRKPIDNSPHNIPESDPYLGFIARDAEIGRKLNGLPGIGCECGPCHSGVGTK